MRGPFGMIYYSPQMSGINSISRKELANNIFIYLSFVRSFAVYLKMPSATQDYKR
jgi:hypothetical protein